MKILIPMAGEGSRFKDVGYETPKPLLMTFDKETKQNQPMILCAVNSIPESEDSQIIFVDRDFHKAQGIEDVLKKRWPKSQFITLDKLTEGQLSTCLKAKEFINDDEELLIGSCDCGIDIDLEKFYNLKKNCDCIVFTFKNNDSVVDNPNAYGWMKVNNDDDIIDVSIKKSISNDPEKDNAVSSIFWFKKGKEFVKAAEDMIAANDRVNNEFYVDQCIKYIIKNGLKAKVLVVDKYFCWGTPKDWEDYQKTVKYWEDFIDAYKQIYKREF